MRGNRLNKFLDQMVGVPLIFLLAALSRLTRSKKGRPASPQKILAVKLAALGDTVLLIPALRRLKKTFPRSRITLLATSLNVDLAQLFPLYIDEVIKLEVGKIVKNPLEFLRFAQELRSKQYDVAFDFEQWALITPIILSLSGIPWITGFKSRLKIRHVLYDEYVERDPRAHEAKNFLNLAALVAGDDSTLELELPVDTERIQMVREELQRRGWKEGERLVVIHPGCGRHGFPREWPVESYKKLCSRLLAAGNTFFVFTGVGGEKKLAEVLAAAVGSKGFVWQKDDLTSFIALLSLADLGVSGNNGVMHLIAALHRPQIALHGPTDARKWGPLNQEAVVIKSSCPECPCLDFGFEYHRTDGFCMAQISVEEVSAAAVKVLDTR